jgi:hypothetical protein
VSAYFLAMVLLSAGAFLHTRSSEPGMRPADPRADAAWRWLSRAALAAWLALLGYGLASLPWFEPVSGFVASLAVNAFLGVRGPRITWPALSMLFSGTGLVLALYAVTR